VRIIKYGLFFSILFCRGVEGYTQALPTDTAQVLQQLPQLIDSLGLRDSLINHPEYRAIIADSLLHFVEQIPATTDTTKTAETIEAVQPPPQKGDIETTIDYKARDSIYFDLKSQKMYLYGESQIEYGPIKLEAEKIELDWVENTIQANYGLDSAGKKVGKPVFHEAGESYVTDDMRYNFATRKAVINGIITEQDGAFMHGERVKKNEKDEMFVSNAKYTTCNHEYPHYYIKSKKLKVIPNNKVVSGPFNIYFGEIPTPIGFPFGMFPQPKEKSSGIIFPTYGEDAARGFFLRNGGYYFDINEYIDLKLTGEIYSRGSYGMQTVSTYRKRYKYSGNLNFRYNKTVSTQFENDSFSKDFWLNWSHSPQSVGTSRFSASVSAGTSSYSANTNNVGQNFNQSINAQFNSNISYSKRFQGTPFNLNLSARHSQNIATGIVNLTLPEVSLNANRMNPFKNIDNKKLSVLKNLGFSYNVVAKNDLSNAPKRKPSFNVVNSSPLDDSVVGFGTGNLAILLDRAQIGARHQIPVTTSFSVLKNLTVSPSFNYTEVWYPKELRYTYVPAQEGVRVDTIRGFSRAGWYSTGASVATRLYGFYPIGGKKIQAIRHVMTPSIGFSYSPDFGDPSKGIYQEVQLDESGATRILSKYEGFAYGSPPLGENMSMSFSLNHNLEMKVKSKKDTVDEFKKIKIFENLSMSSSYNFLADSFNLTNFSWNARTSFFNKAMSVNLNGAIDPYVYVLDSIQEVPGGTGIVHQRRINRFAWNNGQGIGQLNRASVAISFNIRPKSSGGSRQSTNQNEDRNLGGFDRNNNSDNPFLPQDGSGVIAGSVDDSGTIMLDPNTYVPFDIPWGLNVNYSVNYTRRGFEEAKVTQTLSFSGNVSLTQKTKVGFNSGYDFIKNEFTVTRINVSRQLHCWVLNFNWVPFGPRQSYFVEIRVLSQLLKDLKVDKKNRSTFTSF